MAIVRSPFCVVEDFLSPLLCEEVVDLLSFNVPDFDKDDNPVLTKKSHEKCEEIVFERIQQIVPTLENHYGLKYKGTESPILFEWYTEGTEGPIHCESSVYKRKKWLRITERDLTGIIFLCDYNDKIPFEKEFEVYGGKTEFPQHQFGFNPQRGTLIIFPSGPHFINKTTQVYAGDLYQIRFHITATIPYLYDPKNFPGDFTIWFQPYLQPSKK